MFVDGMELTIALKYVLKIDRIRILAYSLYAYGFPLLIVILSLSLLIQEDSFAKKYVLIYESSFIIEVDQRTMNLYI